MLVKFGVAASASRPVRCSRCRRTPLVGERLHVLESERSVCDLCWSGLPESKRAEIRIERVHASERPLGVVPVI